MSRTVRSVGPEGLLISTWRSVTCRNLRKTLILKLLQSLQTLCSPLTTPPAAPGNNGRMRFDGAVSVLAVSLLIAAAAVTASVHARQAEDAVAKAATILAET